MERIRRPSGDVGDCFFAVDNKSRKRIGGFFGKFFSGKTRCADPVVDDIRKEIEEVVNNDQRTVPGVRARELI